MANTYNPSAVGVSAPSGGFQNGGWYSGRQYWNGAVGDPGVIINPGQQGSGQAVSADVIAQTNPKNVSYVNQQRANAGLAPVPGSAGAAPAASGSGSGGVSGTMTPTSKSSLNLPNLYQQMSTQAGLPGLQKKAQAIQAQIDQITNEQNTANANNNENPFLSEANRVGKEQNINTNAQNEINALSNNLNDVNGQISTATSNIQTQLGLQVQQEQIDQVTQENNLNQFNTLLSNGLLTNLSAGDMSNIASSTGLPMSVIQEAVSRSAQADISPQLIQTANGVTLIDANTGNIIKQVNIPGMTSGGSSGTSLYKPGSAASKSEAVTEMQSQLQNVLNSSGNISPEDWTTALQAWLAQGFTKSDFVNNFGQYADTNRGDFYQSYGFKNPNPTWSGNTYIGKGQ